MSDIADGLAALAAPGATLAKTLQAVERIEASWTTGPDVVLGVSSNVSIDLLSTFLRKHALLAGVRLRVEPGSHDDALNDAERFAREGLQGLVFVPYFDNLLPAFELQLDHLPVEAVRAVEEDFIARCRLVLQRAKAMPFVFVTTFHRHGRGIDAGRLDVVAETVERLNAALRRVTAEFPNVRLVDSGAILQVVGAHAAFDERFYLRNTAPYTPAFLDELARRIVAASRAFHSRFHKVLVLDCDNTLWGGVIGEDLLEGIRLDPHSYPGRVYWRVQHALAALERNGVLLCLCSKNNPDDVEEVLTRHPHTVLKGSHIVLRKVNWTDKVTNLRAIAQELNVGLDSMVFLDDSAFECTEVREALPMVRVFQVPAALSDYPRVVDEIRELFLAGGVSAESRSKTAQYRARQEAAESSARYATHEDYLASLGLKVALRRDDASQLARISELTLKSNQFNLTTLRQSPAEIRARMDDALRAVYSLSVSDRFGDAGLTGVVLVDWQGEAARVEAFLMSCRVIGRGVEFSIWPRIARDAAQRGCRVLEAEYRPTAKNAQVADFYDRLGLPLVAQADGTRRYRIALDSFTPPGCDWIEVTHDG